MFSICHGVIVFNQNVKTHDGVENKRQNLLQIPSTTLCTKKSTPLCSTA